MVFVQAALNGDRDHPAAPRDPEAIAREAAAAVAAGAESVHLHPWADGRQTLDADVCAATLRRVRAACPGVPISLTTFADVYPDPAALLRSVEAWTDLPDLVTANQGEPGIVALCELLLERGVGIEAGLLSWSDAEAFVASGLAARCVRVMVEPLDVDPDAAVEHAARIEQIVTDAGIGLPQVHHGEGIACWSVNDRAIARGHGVRTGLEDTWVLPDGSPVSGNADLVAALVARLGPAARRP